MEYPDVVFFKKTNSKRQDYYGNDYDQKSLLVNTIPEMVCEFFMIF